MQIGDKTFEIGARTYIMGILNATPDSFSDGGKYNDEQRAVAQARKMLEEGADIIDVGGESTRPGYAQISDKEEISRIVPVIKAIKREFPKAVISIDTYKSKPLEAAAEAGADMLNDIWGLKYDAEIAKVAKRYNLACCLTHNRNNTEYTDIARDIISDLEISINIAEKAGIPQDKLILDYGIGFAKTYEQNLEVLRLLPYLNEKLRFPVLLGVSRKSVIGKALGDVPTSERLEGTIAATAMAICAGCDFMRVHDVKQNKRAAMFADAVYGRRTRLWTN